MTNRNFLTTIEREMERPKGETRGIGRVKKNEFSRMRKKLEANNLRLNPMTITNAYESGFGAVGSWLGCGESGEVEASAGRGRFQVGSQVWRLAR